MKKVETSLVILIDVHSKIPALLLCVSDFDQTHKDEEEGEELLC